jgi:hypothetical protein
MTTHPIQLRWPGRCHLCAARLPAGTQALFDSVSRELSCRRCATGELPLPEAPPTRRQSEAERTRIKALIAETRAILNSSRRAG